MKYRFDVLGLGCTAVDELLYVTKYPAADTKNPVTKLERQCGGLTARALLAAAHLGARSAYAGMLGDDDASNFVQTTFKDAGIDVTQVVRHRQAQPLRAFVIVDNTRKTRTILYDASHPNGAHPTRPKREVVQSSGVLLIDRFGVPGMIRAARMARRVGRPVVADFENSHWPGFDKLFPLPDHLIVSESFAHQLTRTKRTTSAVERLWSPVRDTVVVTCGAQGCWFRGKQMSKPAHLPAYRVKAVDTTGCGDVFHGAYAAGLARGLPLLERIKLASATAALKATHGDQDLGNPSGLASWQEVQALIRKQPIG